MAEFDLLSSQAYRLFLGELADHLAHADVSCASNQALNQANLEDLSRRFHTIKGGAGFFGLKEIAAASAGLESLFKKPLTAVIDAQAQIHSQLELLQQARANLPQPK